MIDGILYQARPLTVQLGIISLQSMLLQVISPLILLSQL